MFRFKEICPGNLFISAAGPGVRAQGDVSCYDQSFDLYKWKKFDFTNKKINKKQLDKLGYAFAEGGERATNWRSCAGRCSANAGRSLNEAFDSGSSRQAMVVSKFAVRQGR